MSECIKLMRCEALLYGFSGRSSLGGDVASAGLGCFRGFSSFCFFAWSFAFVFLHCIVAVYFSLR